ncbi:MAG: Ribonuclease HII [uncultured bacterium]|nr:MAG: Ribonuclease HII [uncultured bacterium]HBR71468.1 ribonuclease HII [Candidatus Moranbacteria bacterium]
MEADIFEIEAAFFKDGYSFVVGVDEVGRGPLAGPVVACAVALKNKELRSKNQAESDMMWDLVRDSKKLSEKQREKIFDFIQEHFYVGVGLCDHHTIDRINILEASFLAMKKAIQELHKTINNQISITENIKYKIQDTKYIILVDGNKKIPNLSMEQMAIVGGDKIVKSISAASIIAKVIRDRMMMEAHKKYPMYGFDKHKGYGTKIHIDALEKHGYCEIHRQSFAPVKRTKKTLARLAN